MKRFLTKKYLIPVVIIVLAFLWWTVSPLFIDKTVDDTLDPAITAMVENGETSDEVTISTPFPIMDTPTHPATGAVRVIENADETIVRFEGYDGTNGPDLRVYLATDLEASEFIDLGRARGNQGNINYQVPDDVDVSDYRYVMTWCRAFGVLFDYAEIQ